MKRQVLAANPYEMGQFGSFGKAEMMLLKQFNFPDIYDDLLDKLVRADHDRCRQWDYAYFSRCLKKFTGTEGDMFLEAWFQKADDETILRFLRTVLKAGVRTKWTGYRILGTVEGSGNVIWGFELFAKHPQSDTVVYTGHNAPNINVSVPLKD